MKVDNVSNKRGTRKGFVIGYRDVKHRYLIRMSLFAAPETRTGVLRRTILSADCGSGLDATRRLPLRTMFLTGCAMVLAIYCLAPMPALASTLSPEIYSQWSRT